MNKYYASLFPLLFFSVTAIGQSSFPYPATLYAASGKVVATDTLFKNSAVLVIDFWATWCKPCIVKFNTLAEQYETLQKETGVRIVAVSIDKENKIDKAIAMARQYNWPFEMYFDKNQQLFTAMTGGNTPVPHAFFFNRQLKLFKDKTGADVQLKTPIAGKVAFEELYKNGGSMDDFRADVTDYIELVRGAQRAYKR